MLNEEKVAQDSGFCDRCLILKATLLDFPSSSQTIGRLPTHERLLATVHYSFSQVVATSGTASLYVLLDVSHCVVLKNSRSRLLLIDLFD